MLLPPLPAGWASATSVEFYGASARTGDHQTVAVTSSGADLAVDTTDVPDGRRWAVLVGLDSDGETVRRDLPSVDLPEDPGLLVSPEKLAVKAGIPLQLTEDQREVITDAILDAQADVEAYLGRAIFPTIGVEHSCWPWPQGWQIKGNADEPLIRVLAAEAEYADGQPTGYFTVTYLYGLDPAADRALRPIIRFVTAHAMNSAPFTDLWKKVTKAKGEIRSVSAEGQSVSWSPASLGGGGGKAGDGSPGSLPTLTSLDRWRLAGRRVHQGRTRASVWPFSGQRWPG